MNKTKKILVTLFILISVVNVYSKENLNTPLKLEKLKDSGFYTLWYDNDLPMIDSTCSKISPKDIQNYSHFECSNSTDEFADYSCKGFATWKGKKQQIHLMIFKKYDKAACQKKAQSYLDTFS